MHSEDSRKTKIELSRDELTLLANAINESLEIIDDREYSTRTGYDKNTAKQLHRKLSSVLENMA